MTKAGVFQTVRLTMTMLVVTTAAAGCGCPCCSLIRLPPLRRSAPPASAAGMAPYILGRCTNTNADDPGAVNVFGEMKGIKAGPFAVRRRYQLSAAHVSRSGLRR